MHCDIRIADMFRIPSGVALCVPLAFSLVAQDRPVAVFGTTVIIPGGLKGDIYHLKDSTRSLAELPKLRSVGSIYSSTLDVRPQDFSLGFPGVTDRFEWFAIDYSGRFWIERPGIYRFRLVSDDGAMLYVDGQLIIDNDGVHSPEARLGSVHLAGGLHAIRVPYFQGPRDTVALMLEIAGPGERNARPFSTEEFRPPPHPEEWRYLSMTPEQIADVDLERIVPERRPAPNLPKAKRGRDRRRFK